MFGIFRFILFILFSLAIFSCHGPGTIRHLNGSTSISLQDSPLPTSELPPQNQSSISNDENSNSGNTSPTPIQRNDSGPDDLPETNSSEPESPPKGDQSYLTIEGPIGNIQFDEMTMSKFTPELNRANQPESYYDERIDYLVKLASLSPIEIQRIFHEITEASIMITSGIIKFRNFSYDAIKGGPGYPIYGYGVTKKSCEASTVISDLELAELTRELNELTYCEGYKDPNLTQSGATINISLPTGIDAEVGVPHFLGLHDHGLELGYRDFKRVYWSGYKHKMICGNNSLFAAKIGEVLRRAPLSECSDQSAMKLDVNVYKTWD